MDPLIKKLVNKYLGQMNLRRVDYDPLEENARVWLDVPVAMLEEYSQIRARRGELPDGTEFWKETGLAEIIRRRKKFCQRFGSCHLNDVLSQLTGAIRTEYINSRSPKRIVLTVVEDQNETDEFPY